MTYITKRPALSNIFAGDIDRFFGSFFNDAENSISNNYFFPVDISESEEGYRIEAEIPGVDEKEINATVEGNLLTITAKSSTEPKEGEKVLLRERKRGEFSRSFTLPKEADTEAVAAEFNNGVLVLTLPKKEQAKPRTITIEKREAVANEKETK